MSKDLRCRITKTLKSLKEKFSNKFKIIININFININL